MIESQREPKPLIQTHNQRVLLKRNKKQTAINQNHLASSVKVRLMASQSVPLSQLTVLKIKGHLSMKIGSALDV
jgi:hypothetical protein